jgi:hypothetical protein
MFKKYWKPPIDEAIIASTDGRAMSDRSGIREHGVYELKTGLKIALSLAALAATGAISQAAEAERPAAMAEANTLLTTEARESGRAPYSPGQGVAFKPSDHVFVKSALAVDFTYRKATVTLPLFRGLSPSGKAAYFIITDASDFEVARRMGINYAPKLSKAAGSPGVQDVTLEDGVIHFKGNVDFAPVYKVVAGDPPTYFPPKVANPGAVADEQWSSIVALPSGLVLNAQEVENDSGAHDRVTAIDLKNLTVTLSILDGVQGGRQYFYHLVTDASAAVPAVLEKGVFAPRLAMIPAFGQSSPSENSALLGFSPVLNGRTDKGSGEDQGFSTALANGGIDPINVFPIGPENDDASVSNNYSPLWDAHVSMWTAAAIRAGKVHLIHSMDEQKTLIGEGLLTSAEINPAGPGNPYVGGLRPTRAIINCPVIAHPELPPQ